MKVLKRERMIMAFMGMMTMMIGQTAWAQNPFVQTWFTSDPAPMVASTVPWNW